MLVGVIRFNKNNIVMDRLLMGNSQSNVSQYFGNLICIQLSLISVSNIFVLNDRYQVIGSIHLDKSAAYVNAASTLLLMLVLLTISSISK